VVGWIDLERAGRRPYRSGVERDGFIRLDLDHGVASIERNDLSDLERIELKLAGVPANRVFSLPDGSTYTPDLRVQLRDGRLVYVELGPHAEKTEPIAAARLELARVEILKIGALFVVLTDRIVRGRALENARRLHGWGHPIARAGALTDAASALLLACPGRLSIAHATAQLLAEHPDAIEDVAEEAVRAALSAAARRGELLFDLDATELDASATFGIGPEAADLPSWFERLVAGQLDVELPQYESPRAALATPMVRTLQLDLSEEDKRDYQLRLDIVRDRRANPMLTWAELAARHGVSTRRARYWVNEADDYGEAELRPGQRKCTGPRTHEELLETAAKLWRDPRKLGLKAILQSAEMRARSKELGARLSYDQLWRYSQLLKQDAVAVASRKGKRTPTPPAFGSVDPLRKPTVPLQVVQVDAARADVFLLSRNGKHVLERPWILYAVDVASRCLWSWSLCEETPSEADYLRLIQRGIQPKDEVVRVCGATNAYPISGVPQLILADRGWQFAALRSRERLADIGVVVEHAAPYRPDMKGVVERLIGTINQRFIHRLHGTSLSNIAQRGGYDAVAAAKKNGLTIDRFEQLLGQAIIDGYSQEVHSALKATPVEEWTRRTEKYGRPRPWPSDPGSKLRLALLALMDGGSRKRDQRGYFFQNLVYRPSSKDAPKDAWVLYDPEDMRAISILDAQTGEYVCEAIAIDLDPSVAVSEKELATTAKSIAKPTSGTKTLTDLVAAADGPLTKREATRIEKAVRAARERRSEPEGAAAADETTDSIEGEVTAAPEITLEAMPDFKDAA
jgi:transposase InsO family protein